MINKLLQLPRERKIRISSDKTHCWMICQWHLRDTGEKESTASFKINLVPNGKFKPGTGRCFSCSKFISKFEEILDPNNKDTIESEEYDSKVYSLYNNSQNTILRDEDDKGQSLANPIEWGNEDWRSIPFYLMQAIKAKLIYDEEHDNLLAYLPCEVEGKHIGGIRANTEKKGKLNYFNTPGSWTKSNGLFPYDYTKRVLIEKKLNYVVLVEGPRDALKLLQYGIPALAILGTGNYSETKTELILNLNLNQIILAMDADKAGKKATIEIYDSLKKEIYVRRFNFGKYGVNDACEASPEILNRMKGLMDGLRKSQRKNI